MKAPVKGNNGPKMSEIVEPGMYKAVLYSIIDMGTQESKEYGPKRQLLLQRELPEVMHTFSEDKGPQPVSVSSTFNLSMHEKSALRKLINSWLGKPLTDKEAEDFEIGTLLGKTCFATIVHNGDFINLTSVTPLKKSDKVLVPINDLRMVDLDEFNQITFDSLSEKMKSKIMNSPEYKNKDTKNDLPDEVF